jgi:hypothetical protein
VFVPGHLADLNTLLQGDVLKEVQLLGALSYQEILVASPVTGGGQPQNWTVPKPPITGDAMVLSHSCEVSLENDVKVTSIILAPLRDVSKATAPDKVRELIDSNLIDQANPEASYLKYFYLQPHEQLAYTQGAIADFSKLFSVRKSSYAYLLSRKVLQLDDATRFSMSLKLALYFHRNDEEAA